MFYLDMIIWGDSIFKERATSNMKIKKLKTYYKYCFQNLLEIK